MHKSESGFSHIALLIIFVAAVVAGSGYLVYKHSHTTTVTGGTNMAATTNGTPSLANPTAQSNNVNSVASSIDSVATSLSSSETALDSQSNTNDQTSDTNLGVAATNVGGGYNANNY